MGATRLTRREPASLLCLLLVSGCASAGGRYRLAAATETFAATLVQSQLVVMEAYASGQLPRDAYLRWQRGFLQLAQAGKALTAALRTRQEPAALDEVLAQVATLGGEVGGLPGPIQPAMRASLDGLRLSALVLAVAGGG